MKGFKTIKIEDIKQNAVGTTSFYFGIPEGITWEAGAEVHFAFPGFMDNKIPNKDLIRHMSIMTLPEEGKIGFTTRVPGSGSIFKKRLKNAKIGDEMVMFKLGNRIVLRREDKDIVMISMGVGVTTMRPLINKWLIDPSGVPPIINIVVDKKDNFVFRDEFESKIKDNFKNIFCENRSDLYNNIEQINCDGNKIFYIVGSDEFLDDIIKKLKVKNVLTENIMIDKKDDKKALMLGNN